MSPPTRSWTALPAGNGTDRRSVRAEKI